MFIFKGFYALTVSYGLFLDFTIKNASDDELDKIRIEIRLV